MNTVQSGNMSTLNCPEEFTWLEKLINLHDWADMVDLQVGVRQMQLQLE